MKDLELKELRDLRRFVHKLHEEMESSKIITRLLLAVMMINIITSIILITKTGR